MPRRKRSSSRREVNALDAMSAFASAQAGGCSMIPDNVRDLDALYTVFDLVGADPGSWAHEAFVRGSERPCETMAPQHDGFGVVEAPGCGSTCLFGER
jgi:hypothetical protein